MCNRLMFWCHISPDILLVLPRFVLIHNNGFLREFKDQNEIKTWRIFTHPDVVLNMTALLQWTTK